MFGGKIVTTEQSESSFEDALVQFMREQGYLENGELITEWIVLAAAVPADEDHSTVILAVSKSTMSYHATKGLLFTHLFEHTD
jgi:hypothetical protein